MTLTDKEKIEMALRNIQKMLDVLEKQESDWLKENKNDIPSVVKGYFEVQRYTLNTLKENLGSKHAIVYN